jgi:phage shock protein A
MSNVDVAVARLEVQVERLEKDMTEMKADIKAMRAVLDQANGGWKMFMFIGGVGAALGGLLFKAFDMMWGK